MIRSNGSPRFSKALFLAAVALALCSAASADVVKVVINDTIHPITDEVIGRAIDELFHRSPSGVNE